MLLLFGGVTYKFLPYFGFTLNFRGSLILIISRIIDINCRGLWNLRVIDENKKFDKSRCGFL